MPARKRSASRRPARQRPSRARRAAGELWLYGSHAVAGALANPARAPERLVMTDEARRRLPDMASRGAARGVRVETATAEAVAALLPPGAVHQGVALLAAPLAAPDLAEACRPGLDGRSLVVVLDQVTDPRNLGAVLRSAAAFGVRAVVVQDRNSPPESGALAKAASGAVDLVPMVRVTNLSRALESLAGLGYWRIGLDSGAGAALDGSTEGTAVALVLGAEGAGLRRLTAEHCDASARLVTALDAPASLNVSVAAALSMYEMRR